MTEQAVYETGPAGLFHGMAVDKQPDRSAIEQALLLLEDITGEPQRDAWRELSRLSPTAVTESEMK